MPPLWHANGWQGNRYDRQKARQNNVSSMRRLHRKPRRSTAGCDNEKPGTNATLTRTNIMGLVKTANPIIDIRGSVGGSIFSKDRSGLHMVSPKRAIRSDSTLQTRRRRAFVAANGSWKRDTTPHQKSLWQLYATRHPGHNRLGEVITYTGYQMSMRFNIYRAYNNVSLILSPPEG